MSGQSSFLIFIFNLSCVRIFCLSSFIQFHFVPGCFQTYGGGVCHEHRMNTKWSFLPASGCNLWNRTRPRALVQNQHTRENVRREFRASDTSFAMFYNKESVWKSSKHTHISKRQHWHTSTSTVRTDTSENYRRWFRFLLLCLCEVFRALGFKFSRFYWAFCRWGLESEVIFTHDIPYEQVHEYY